MLNNKTATNKFTLSATVIALSIALSAGLIPVSTAIAAEDAIAKSSGENVQTNTSIASNIAATANVVKKIDYVERIQIIGHGNKLRTEGGSATLIGEAELEKFKFDDINRVLYNVPGVNIREEDGYGLRPNIGFRGATPERSKKITVMEDGILIGPAPYSAPAAYYFPMMSKMTSLEVFKGPAAIKYGPNTVAGALNMTTRAVPDAQEGMIDLSAGADGYTKAHGYYGTKIGGLGVLVEAINMQADGFKELDGGGSTIYDNGDGNTGFDKNDIMAKFRYDLTTGSVDHTFGLKVSYADEKSNETYLGLTDDDFYTNPDRRYAASELDNMDWQHEQFQFTHFMQTNNFDITTRVYRNNFERSWFKINGFKGGPDLQEILANPNDEDQDGTNAHYYQILTGDANSVLEEEKIIVGDNAREYYSQGIQTELYFEQQLFGLAHKFNVGARFHQDQIERNHTEDTFDMREGHLINDGSEQVKTTTNREKTDAIAVFFKDTIKYDALDITLGLRGEFIDSTYQNRVVGEEDDWQKKSSHIWLPSLSLFYTVNENLGLLFGVHEGFIPTSPKEGPETEIENSVNYEFGGRFYQGALQAEVIFFYNDMSNLKESCSFSAASSCGDSLDKEFNGSEVDVYGLEFTTSYTAKLSEALELPMSVVYTYSDSEFKNSFESDFPMWGTITAGDGLPYLAEHQLTLNLGLTAEQWDINFIARYVGEMLEASGEDVILSGEVTESSMVVDLSASYYLGQYGKVYLKADNILDSQEIVSRRPYGARPSKPQQMFVGYQYNF
ncbi:TonB-dependent receptor family protein [Colwellia psychrerythraea]|uniref:TonB-dependent receptor plug n=1 Tax=Colwellia psychrerythraea TaxID=28229 RepID=A0A099KGN0_COLPS|nr:TonB-dependent receptor [Colwellia psychrerythraea]KGJ89122.1 TonB-dependent receptor plug [Colwellia psychrerythraea]